MKHARDDYNRIQDPAGIIPEDEPVFLIRGQDRAALAALEAWIHEARRLGADREITDAAERQQQAMIAWQDERPAVSKVPDMPTQVQA